MKRRQFLKLSLMGGILVSFSGGGCMGLLVGKNKEELTVDSALRKLDKFTNTTIVHLGQWSPYQIFTHCAQSVEYSMSGYPEHDSDLFKSTVGTLVFSYFSLQGKMSHDLTAPVPGAPPIEIKEDSTSALVRLRKALMEFQDYQGKLEPHFSYGELSKEEFTVAHVIHLNNHLEELKI
ncbi:DUF1569 domain-containing protein [Candidatus Nitronereus thalassa]|uniref:DUF1569 domain-containing protein n=1 Tax=Candidatus Nitronereus thalassa TaxID=3020898 RepID=A0ABU3K965_9BACT|nr:DUF1569 domain-containing protein [Candidatus Nitronereus thalassa]MDT7042930.1 DUF1569 domain-containing protein [Candidatus Nitronereus thalassa]